MDSFKEIKSKLIPLDMINVDTDQIIPKQFLKLIQKVDMEIFFSTIGVLIIVGIPRSNLSSMTQNIKKDKYY